MIDWIQGEKFIGIADFTFAPAVKHADDYNNLPNTLNLNRVRNGDVIYTHTFYVKQLFEVLDLISGTVVVVSHNSDVNVDDSFRVPKSVSKWYTTNVNTVNPKIESIPIGLENSRWFKLVDKKTKMERLLREPRDLQNWVYVNHNNKTNPAKREYVYDVFKDQSWATVEWGKNGIGFDNYINKIRNHHFVVCPEGNGMDTHRTWECMYMKTIPIEIKNHNNTFYEKILPILLVDKWEDVTEHMLYTKVWDFNKRWAEADEVLSFEYWKNKILSGK
jgi:hypothetical protein